MSSDKIAVIAGGLAAIALVVWFFDVGKSANLSDAPGEYEFHCQMGMLLIVE